MPDGSYFLSRYDDCAAVYRDPDTWSSDKTHEFRPKFGDSLLYEHHTTSLVFNDPPCHTHVRKLHRAGLRAARIAEMETRIEALVDRLIDRDGGERGAIDLIEDFAAAIPVEMIGDMLGVPHESAVRCAAGRWRSSARSSRCSPRSKCPAATRRCASSRPTCAISSSGRRAGSAAITARSAMLIAASDPPASTGEQLSELELLHNCIFILNAGHETTTNLIGNGSNSWSAIRIRSARERASPR